MARVRQQVRGMRTTLQLMTDLHAILAQEIAYDQNIIYEFLQAQEGADRQATQHLYIGPLYQNLIGLRGLVTSLKDIIDLRFQSGTSIQTWEEVLDTKLNTELAGLGSPPPQAPTQLVKAVDDFGEMAGELRRIANHFNYDVQRLQDLNDIIEMDVGSGHRPGRAVAEVKFNTMITTARMPHRASLRPAALREMRRLPNDSPIWRLVRTWVVVLSLNLRLTAELQEGRDALGLGPGGVPLGGTAAAAADEWNPGLRRMMLHYNCLMLVTGEARTREQRRANRAAGMPSEADLTWDELKARLLEFAETPDDRALCDEYWTPAMVEEEVAKHGFRW